MTSRPTKLCPECTYQITFATLTRCPRCGFELDRAGDSVYISQRRGQHDTLRQAQAPSRQDSQKRNPELRTARNWYWWLWLSPLLTLPTALAVGIFIYSGIGRDLACSRGLVRGYYRYQCDYVLREMMSLIPAFVVSALWHLVLLIPARDKRIFVRWHGRQALMLAGLRTAVPLLSILASLLGVPYCLAIILLILIWFAGTWWGWWQAKTGRCSLMGWTGHQQTLADFQQTLEQPIQHTQSDPESLVRVIRYSSDPSARKRALEKLRTLGMVEHL